MFSCVLCFVASIFILQSIQIINCDQNNAVKRSAQGSNTLHNQKPRSWNKEVELVQNHENWKLLQDFVCGETFTDKIIGGKDAALGQFPWTARIAYFVPEKAKGVEYRCGGALISRSHVLSAGHCVDGLPSGVTVAGILLGEYDTKTKRDCRGSICAPIPQYFRVKSIVVPANLNNPEFAEDIALIRLAGRARLNNFVLPICLPRGDELTKSFVGDTMTVTGWGTVSMKTMETAHVLQAIDLPILDHSKCKDYEEVFILTDQQLCAGAQENKDACGGDSGGPMSKVIDTPTGPKSFLMAVVSFGPDMCGTSMPGIYTSVPKFMYWILENLTV